jgi:hypothetical protein
MSRQGDQDAARSTSSIPGGTDKNPAAITTQLWEPNIRYTLLLWVLHECVHFISHPPGQGRLLSTAWGHLEEGLLVRLVEMLSENNLTAQGLFLPAMD